MKSRLPRRAERKKAGPRCGGPPRELAIKSQFPARAAVMMAMEQLPLNVPFCGDPLGFKCSGRQSRPSAKVLSWGQNACTRHSARPIVVAMAQATFSWPFGPIHLESTRLRFRLVAKTALVPLLLLFPANPLRWASPGGTREITQNAAGDAADGLRLRFAPPRSIGPLSPDPITGDAYLLDFPALPARKI